MGQVLSLEQRLRNIIEGNRAGTWEWNVQTGEVVFNERWAEIVGYTLEEISPVTIETWMQFAHPVDLEKSNELLQKYFRGDIDYYECEARMKHRDGHWVWVLDRGKVYSWTDDGEPEWRFGTHIDITDKVSVREELQHSEERFRALSEASYGGVVIHDKGLILDCNQGLSDLTGFSREELIGMDGFRLIEPKSLDIVLANVRSGYKERYEVEGVRKDGSIYPLSIKGKNVQYKGRDVRVIEFFDLTESKQTENALKESEERFQKMFRDHDALMLIIDPENGQIIDANDAAIDFYGFSAEEFRQLAIQDINTLPDEEVAEARRKAIHAEQTTFEFQHRLQSGELKDVEVHVSIIQLNNQPVLFSIIHDITERKRLFAEQSRSAQLAALGTVAAGVAHEINNPIQGILNYAELIDRAPERIERNQEFAKRIKDESLRVAKITQELLFYSKDSRIELKQVHPKDIIEGALSLVKSKIRNDGIVVETEFADNLRSVFLQPQSIQQVIMNLVDNACDALRYKSETTQQRRISIRAYLLESLASPELCVEVYDNGIGMDENVLQRSQEAFFTTKPPAEGTGLGLSIVGDIVKKHNGRIEMQSRLNSYTIIKVIIPAIFAETIHEAKH